MTGAPMQATSRAGPSDPLGAEHSLVVPDPLRGLDQAGLLRPVDVHGARTLCRIADDDRDEVLLAVALAVRSPRLGSVCVDLSTIAGSLVAEGDVGQDLEQLVEWPDLDAWRDVLVASPLVGRSGEDQTPLVLDGTRLYLDRYWRYEQRVVEELVRRASREALDVDLARLREGIDRLLPRRHDGERPDRQRLAAAMAVLRQLTVVAGGPGTGKTTTVAAMLALLHEQATAAGQPPPRVALAAPTGKAAARLTGALHEASGRLALDDAAGQALRDAEAGTLHRLLGMRPGAGVRSRHHRRAPLPHDVVVVDETSMVSLSLIARLLDAVRPDARLVLLGDPHQLASVEAGSVLGDVVGPVGEGLVASTPTRDRLAESTAEDRAAIDALTHESGPARLADGIVVLRRVHRFDESSAIAALARAVHEGDVTRAMQVLEDGDGQVHWLRPPDDPATDAWLSPVRDRLVEVGGRLLDAARRGDARDALELVDRVRVLCAHRRGPHGVASWVPRVEHWLVDSGVGLDVSRHWYVGRPVIVTRNDHRLGVFNGDVGVTVAAGDTVAVALEGVQEPRLIHPGRLEAVESVHAMTIHRSQGAQFDHAVVVLPEATSPILTRELLYTAVTRAREGVSLVGSGAAIEAAVSRPIARASGLREALWGAPDGS